MLITFTNFTGKEIYAKVCLHPTITCSILLPINIWKLHNNITPGNIHSCNNIIETLHIQVWYLPYGGWKGEMSFFIRMTRDHKRSEGKKGREEEKRRQEQSKIVVRTAAEKNRQRNQGERKQINVIKKTCWARFLPSLCFRAGKEGSFSYNSL